MTAREALALAEEALMDDAKITPGPWEYSPGVDPPGHVIAPDLGEQGPLPFITCASWGREIDAEWIAAARTREPQLAAIVRAWAPVIEAAEAAARVEEGSLP